MPIEVKNLDHVYMRGTPFEKKALDGINFSISDGEFVGIIGHTGSGKSTLISHFNALLRPEGGKVIVNGTDISEKDADLKKVRREVGLVFQYPEYQLFEETVEKDIAFGPKNLGCDDAEIKSRVDEALALVGLDGDISEKSPFELSGGQKRRVAIAGVLAMRPKILVLDEPAAGLDPEGRGEMLALIKGLHDSGRTVVMVSHSMDDIGRLCERLIVLNQGKIAFDDAPENVFAHADELVEMGLGVPECVKLGDRLRARGFGIPKSATDISAMADAIMRNLKNA